MGRCGDGGNFTGQYGLPFFYAGRALVGVEGHSRQHSLFKLRGNGRVDLARRDEQIRVQESALRAGRLLAGQQVIKRGS